MRDYGFPVSAVLHVLILGAIIFVLPGAPPLDSNVESLPVEVMTSQQFDALTKGEKTAKEQTKQARKVDKVAPPTDTPDSNAPDIKADTVTPPLPPQRDDQPDTQQTAEADPPPPPPRPDPVPQPPAPPQQAETKPVKPPVQKADKPIDAPDSKALAQMAQAATDAAAQEAAQAQEKADAKADAAAKAEAAKAAAEKVAAAKAAVKAAAAKADAEAEKIAQAKADAAEAAAAKAEAEKAAQAKADAAKAKADAEKVAKAEAAKAAAAKAEAEKVAAAKADAAVKAAMAKSEAQKVAAAKAEAAKKQAAAFDLNSIEAAIGKHASKSNTKLASSGAPATVPSKEPAARAARTGDAPSQTASTGAPDADAPRLSLSEKSAMQSMINQQIKPCLPPSFAADSSNAVATLRLQMNDDGTLAATPQLVSAGSATVGNTATRAVIRCITSQNPVKFKREYYASWKVFNLVLRQNGF